MSFSASRIAAGFSLDQVSAEFRVPAATVKSWEAGTEQPPAQVTNSLEMIGRMSLLESSPGISPRQAEFKAIRDEGPLFKSDKLIKSKQRVADHGEVFTPPWLVEKMLDLVKGETERIDSRFLEPACGSGNFLVPILQRKLAAVEAKYGKVDFEKRHYALLALTCCYGIELLADNISECRANMLDVFAQYLRLDEDDELYHAASHVLSLNLIHGDAMTMKDADGEPILIVEWGYIGKGKFQRRDFRLDVLTGMSSFREERTLFAHLGSHEIFKPAESYPPMAVRELAALDMVA
ncbi:SAM-dependent methyltransferase [Sphingopyxis sp. BSN-002]|uniref:N-6 DNA methylase n=1 Tax=Sphingopyxis sp. BSN-002 TaxID=2911495 RepID=UPI001EDB31AF|nr:N-6 DNA methylase [Sphingopyxis sp. BSN-002]UKK85758.1 SAM-dependent methyltransferase [Sphingopyxis sp. BSN-002]